MYKILSRNLIKLAQECPYPLYIVGGRVRDYLAGLVSEKSDTDICAPADAEDFIARARAAGFVADAVYGNTGTVKLSAGGEDMEFACFRSDEYVRGEHRPSSTYLTDDINLDARRRDFKCNAVYYDIKAHKFADPLGGIPDIKNKRLTTVAAAEKVFGEDGLRLMRLARIAAQTGFVPDEECMNGARLNARLIQDVSAERIFSELNEILHADKKYGIKYAQYRGLDILRKTCVLQYIIPELAAGDGLAQRRDFHDHDVLEHSFRAVKYADESIRFPALLHDVGKPYCMQRDGNCHSHDAEGARMCEEICARLKTPKKLRDLTVKLTALHMYDVGCVAKENKIRKFIILNYGVMKELLLLKQADFSACKDDMSVAPSVEKFNSVINKMKNEGVPFTLKELDVKGNELISSGISPKITGKVLERLLLDCAVHNVDNSKSSLLKRAKIVANDLNM